ncbi:MAG: DUF1499 domain-containing protein [Deltaproteobacteria bacterium]
MKTLFLYLVFNFLGLILAMTAGAATHLAPSPSSPNCVSSQATDKHFIKPLTITGKAGAAFAKLKEILARRPGTTIISADGKIIRLEFKTTLGFVDDGIFALDAGKRVINIRSASRIGYYYFGPKYS